MNAVEDLLENALEAAGRVERPSIKSADYAAIAEVYLQRGQGARARDRCLEVLKLALIPTEKIKLPDEKAACLAYIAGLYKAAGNGSLGKEYFTRAGLLAGAAETAAQQVRALFEVARGYSEAGLETEALKVLDRIYCLVKEPQNNLDTACELIDLAMEYCAINRRETAGNILAEAVVAALAIKDSWFKIERLTGAAETYIAMDDLSGVRDVLEKLTPFLLDIAEIDRAAFWMRIAEVYKLAKDIPRALESLKAALVSIRLNTEAVYQAENLLEIARLYYELEQRPVALEILEILGRKWAEIEDFKDKVSILTGIAGLLGQRGEKAQALETATQALELCRAYQNRKETMYLLGNLAVVYAGLGEKEKVAQIVANLSVIAVETRAKTSGLGVIAAELCETGEPQAALVLANLISEPHTRAESLTRIAGSLV